MWAHWASYAGPVSVTANAVVPVGWLRLRAAALRPYAIAGAGAYGVGTGGPTLRANVGAGLRLAVGRVGAFAEARRHGAYARTFLTVGATMRP
jgi:hypothetical protein